MTTKIGSPSGIEFPDATIQSSAMYDRYYDYGGTLDAIELAAVGSQTPTTALRVGQVFRFQASAANTGPATADVDELGPQPIVTVTGDPLPAGYIRDDVMTSMVWDGSNFVADRAIERITNADGVATRYADGSQICVSPEINTGPGTISTGSLFLSTLTNWDFPSAFVNAEYAVCCTDTASTQSLSACRSATASTANVRVARPSSTPTDRIVIASAQGYWY